MSSADNRCHTAGFPKHSIHLFSFLLPKGGSWHSAAHNTCYTVGAKLDYKNAQYNSRKNTYLYLLYLLRLFIH